MNLTPRLKAIASYVKEGSTVADIGTDHGYVPVFLIENKIASSAIAADVNEGPLNNAEAYIEEKELSDKIETRLGDGLKALKPNEVDTVIIAGMGGTLIANILKESKEVADKIDRFILQPMVASDELRKYLYNNNYKIVDEKLIREGKRIYEIICAEHGAEEVEDEIYYDIGEKLIEKNDELLKDFIEMKMNKLSNIIKNLENASSTQGKKKYEKLNRKYNQYKELIDSI
ncbi:Putative tRNA-m1A22 methylase [Caldisalinibacter kiritimatiensis]|uniref:Putative tRNA-m1A22 methylase n=2 Tax=Caldisalinibacter kiritimatiensis TaxID=1304284 RepID=R1CGT4_9FIRM|nr:Putative tRNA-m1A22 methylase [Caldisalinibacter kiritimatiensis]